MPLNLLRRDVTDKIVHAYFGLNFEILWVLILKELENSNQLES